MTQSHLIVKEEGICIYRAPEKLTCENPCQLPQGICECDDLAIEENEALKQAQSSAILVENQERAMQLIVEHHFMSSGHLVAPAFNFPYPVPGIEFEEFLVNTKFPEPPSPDDIKKVARLIEHTAEKECPTCGKNKSEFCSNSIPYP